jgi:hypothetical protein
MDEIEGYPEERKVGWYDLDQLPLHGVFVICGSVTSGKTTLMNHLYDKLRDKYANIYVQDFYECDDALEEFIREAEVDRRDNPGISSAAFLDGGPQFQRADIQRLCMNARCIHAAVFLVVQSIHDIPPSIRANIYTWFHAYTASDRSIRMLCNTVCDTDFDEFKRLFQRHTAIPYTFMVYDMRAALNSMDDWSAWMFRYRVNI